MRTRLLVIALLLLAARGAWAQDLAQRFLPLLQTAGVAGHEDAVREAVRRQLPAWARPLATVDEAGNLRLSLGRGEPHVALVAALDEPGYVVSRITDDGFLRLHRHTTGPAGVAQPLRDQFLVGQPVQVSTASGRLVDGVTATPSTHLSRLTPAAEVARIKDLQDLWVDVGASNAAGVAALGIRMLDAVSLRERAQGLAQGRVAGVATQLRAGAQALVEVVRGLPEGAAVPGTVTLAWVTQSQFGGRGLARLAQTIRPRSAVLVGRGGAVPEAPAAWAGVTLSTAAVPVLFPDTPVETVATADIARLAGELAGTAGLTAWRAGAADSAAAAGPAAPTRPAPLTGSYAVLQPLIESYGVSGAEAPVREVVLSRLPAWARPEIDAKGNITVSFGHGGKELLFIAHMDEVGFEITDIRDDGSAAIKVAGGVYLSLYEAHPVRVMTPAGPVAAVIAPRTAYGSASRSQPELASLGLYFGTQTAAETRSLGVQPGQTLTVRKSLVALAPPRATGRSMDDRVGVAALLLALRQIDPAKVANRVTFAFSVDEEVGLGGARALAERLQPQVAFAIDTFVSTETPLDLPYLAHAPLGRGPVLRGVDSRTLVPARVIDRITALAAAQRIPLQINVTQGGTDASAFAARGAIDVGLSWPGRYSHSPVEVVDQRDLDALVRLIGLLAQQY